MSHGTEEANGRGINYITVRTEVSDLSGTISKKESGRLGGVVAGELEALTKAVRPYPEGVGDVDTPTP